MIQSKYYKSEGVQTAKSLKFVVVCTLLDSENEILTVNCEVEGILLQNIEIILILFQKHLIHCVAHGFSHRLTYCLLPFKLCSVLSWHTLQRI